MILFNASNNYQRSGSQLYCNYFLIAKLHTKAIQIFFGRKYDKEQNVQYNNLSSVLNCQINDIIDSNQRFFFER